MKKLTFALSLLAFLAAATSAHAVEPVRPVFNQTYACLYSPSPWTNEAQGGWSIFNSPRFINPDLIYAIEVYQTAQSYDNRRVAFAKPKSYCGSIDPDCILPGAVAQSTTWEFTISYGVQCSNTVVYNHGKIINFAGCSNGKIRTCAF